MSVDWLDDHSVPLLDAKRDAAFLSDTTTKTAREIPGVRGPCEFRFRDGGRTLSINRQRREGDIWMSSFRNSADR
jgi:hypothetical protein